jgi:phosphate transport system substrate-binding protein
MSVFMSVFAMICGASIAVDARDQIRIVGSSTVFPFATAVAEEYGRTTLYRTPIVESTGSGGGFKLFCAGIGDAHPDITNASRRIKVSELLSCASNGVEAIEVNIGYDGIVLANSVESELLNITLRQLFLALAKQVPDTRGKLINNPYKKWNEIDPGLPDVKIEVLGPSPTSGTRDAFNELAMEGGCKTFPDIEAIGLHDKKKFKAICQAIREDGHYIEAGENDNLIVQKLDANKNAFGIFGFSFLDQNGDIVQGSTINGVTPAYENISSGTYPVSRSLYFYIKNAHIKWVKGITEYATAFISEEAIGEFGYLKDKGLISLPEDELVEVRERLEALMPLNAHDLLE